SPEPLAGGRRNLRARALHRPRFRPPATRTDPSRPDPDDRARRLDRRHAGAAIVAMNQPDPDVGQASITRDAPYRPRGIGPSPSSEGRPGPVIAVNDAENAGSQSSCAAS